MLKGYIFYRFVRTTFMASFLLSLILFTLQFTRLGTILLGLPPEDLLGFLLVWSVFYTYFFLPDGIILATAFLINSFKERKLIHVFYSFRISERKLLYFFFIPFLSVYLLLVGFSQTLLEEKVAFVRKNLVYKFQENFFKEIPTKTFINFGGVVIHAEERTGNKLRNIFFKFGEITILAKTLEYRGNGLFEFSKGTVITEEEKIFVIRFEKYLLNIRQFEKKELRERRLRESKFINIANALITPFLFLGVFYTCLRKCNRITHSYALVSAFILFHQIIIFIMKILL
ncbi:MAG TPA: LptF/LptG family permease [Aquifex aeolicus]|nr:LptF/LptG family permease [Aquifex aeolicus]